MQKGAFCVGVGGWRRIGRRINGKAFRIIRQGRAMCESERFAWEWGPAVRKTAGPAGSHGRGERCAKVSVLRGSGGLAADDRQGLRITRQGRPICRSERFAWEWGVGAR